MNLDKEILRLSVPAIVSNITVPLLGLCDTGISGHLGSELFLAAIAVGTMMLNVIFWLFGFLRMGTTGLTASAFGSKNEREESKVFSRSFFLGLLLGFLLVAFQNPVLELLLRLIHPEPEVEDLVRAYFRICIWEAPSLLATMSISGWFVGMQCTIWPMVIAISVNVINIIASLLLVFHFSLGFEGIAIGTVSANWTGLLIGIIAALRFRRGRGLFCSVREIVDGGGLLRFFTVNVNLFFRSFCIIMVSLGVTAAGARLGAMTLAVNAILMQFFTFFSFFMDGFAFSAEALTGRWHGERNVEMMKRSVKALLKWTLMVAVVFSILYFLGNGEVTAMLTDEVDVRTKVKGMSLWIWLIPLVSAWAFIYDGFFVGITDTGKMLLATFVATAVFFAVAFLRIGDGIEIAVSSNESVWCAFLSYLFLRGVVLAILWPAELRKKM